MKVTQEIKMSSAGDIIAIGGGGFGRTPESPLIEKYIIKQAKKKNPKICFFPTFHV